MSAPTLDEIESLLLHIADSHPLLAVVLGFVAVFVPMTGWAWWVACN